MHGDSLSSLTALATHPVLKSTLAYLFRPLSLSGQHLFASTALAKEEFKTKLITGCPLNRVEAEHT